MIIYFNYITTNKINGKQYVGAHKTDNIDDGYLGSGKYLLRAIKKYGKESFTRKIINKTDTIEQAHKNEKFLVEVFETLVPNGYNISPTGGLGINGCHSEETKEKIGEANSKALKGKPKSKEHVKNMSKALIGREFTEEWRNNLRESNIGKKRSKKTKKNMSEAHTGVPLSEEHKQSLRVPKSEEGKQNMRRLKTKEERQKISIALMGNTNVKGKIWIYKNGKNKRIKKEEVTYWEKKSWKLGRSKWKKIIN